MSLRTFVAQGNPRRGFPCVGRLATYLLLRVLLKFIDFYKTFKCILFFVAFFLMFAKI
jgi:hypothetical protein